jgi:hypothetical protein
LEEEENMRLRIISRILAIWIGAMVIGCGSTVRFAKPAPESLVLGKTTYQEAVVMYGKPTLQQPMTLNGENVNSATWSFVGAPDSQPFKKYHIPNKSLAMWFWSDSLVGYVFTSSFQEDKTDFDESQIPRIKKGETRVEEVVKLLGPAPGFLVYPCIRDVDTKALKYFYQQLNSSSDLYTEDATISYNKEGIVTDVTYSTSGVK